MANLKEFNFRHQTAALSSSQSLRNAPPLETEEEEEISRVAGPQRGRWLRTSKQNSLSTRGVMLVRLRPRGASVASK